MGDVKEETALDTIQPKRELVTKELLCEYLDAFGLTKQLSENEKKQFINIAQAYGLNPFKREIYCTAYGQGEYRTLSIITGYEVYLKRAERSGKLNGWSAWTEGEGEERKAIVQIYRKDWTQPFRHEVFWKEAVQKKRDGTPNAIWAKQPGFQLKKVAISQGFRLAFPEDLGGIPYEEAELPSSETIVCETGEDLGGMPYEEAELPSSETIVCETGEDIHKTKGLKLKTTLANPQITDNERNGVHNKYLKAWKTMTAEDMDAVIAEWQGVIASRSTPLFEDQPEKPIMPELDIF